MSVLVLLLLLLLLMVLMVLMVLVSCVISSIVHLNVVDKVKVQVAAILGVIAELILIVVIMALSGTNTFQKTKRSSHGGGSLQ